MKRPGFVLIVAALMAPLALCAQRTADIDGAEDYPLVSRFAGSVIAWYEVKDFDRYYVLSLAGDQLTPNEVDGKITRIQYSAGEGHSVFEIIKSYENALKKAGFAITLTLDEKNCGLNLSEQLYMGEFNGLNSLPREALKPDYRDKFAYLTARQTLDDKTVYVVVYVTDWNYPLITFDAIEVKAMDEGLVTVRSLADDLAATGHIAIYDIYFATGKADVKPESAAVLETIATYLKANPDKRYFIVGHTDSQGGFEANMALSENRAQAVMAYLVNDLGVDARQLKAYGVSSLAPVASNQSASGQAKNRRVEIVEQ